MLGIYSREHLLLAQELVVVLFGLGIEARVVIGIPGLRAGCAGVDRLVQTTEAARAGFPSPRVVAMSRLGISIVQQAGAASVLGSKLGSEQEQPQAVGMLEVRIGGQRLGFGTADQIVAGIVAQLSVRDLKEGLVVARVNRVAVKVSQIVVVRLNRAEHVV